MEYSMRLELTLVCSLNVLQLVMVLCRSHTLFFLECVYLSLLYSSLIFDMFLSLCVCVLEWFWISLRVIFFLCVGECVSWGYFYVFMFGSAVWNLLVTFWEFLSVCIYIYISMYTCVCVCVCVCVYIYIYIYVYFQLDAFVREHVWHKVKLMGNQCDMNLVMFVVGMVFIHFLCIYIYIYIYVYLFPFVYMYDSCFIQL